jgi:hypothetical protein
VKHLLTLTAAALLGLGAAAYAEGPQGAAVPHEPLPDAPSDAKSGSPSPQAAAGDEQMLARCGDELKASSRTAGNPASVQEQPDAHAQRVRAVVKLYVAEELAKTKNGKGCLALADQARELLASTDQPAASGSSR